MSLQRLLHALQAVVVMAAMTTVVIPSASAAPELDYRRAANTQAAVNAASPSLTREVFGFALASSLSDPTVGYPSWNFSLLSTVAFFGLHVNWDGKLVADSGWTVWNSSALTGLLSTARAHGTKVVLTIILQDFAAGTPNMCAGLINRANTVAQTVAQVAAKGVDGVNVDYEGLNGTCQNGQTARAMMTDFVRRLRAALPSGSYLSVDTYASSAADPIGFFDVRGMNPYVNSFFVMAYDLEYSNWRRAPLGCSRFCLGPTAPLTGYYYNDTNTAAQYAAAVGAEKVILGVPYYGRAACVSSATPNQYPAGSVTAVTYLSASDETSSPQIRAGSYVAHRDAHDPSGHERWDTWFNTSMNCTRELYWDDTASLGAKYDLVTATGLRGVGIWNLNYGGGARELWSTLALHFAACRSVAVSASPASPAIAGTAVTITAGAAGCPHANPLYAFWLLRPGSATWQLAQAYSAKPAFSWNTAGLPIGAYRISVWVHDSGNSGVYGNSLGRYDAFNAGQYYTLKSIPCTAVSVATSPAAPTMAGTTVTITGQAAGCPKPQYEFWILNPGPATWQLGQAYTASATFNWSTAGKAAGTYRFSVWARDASSTGAATNSLGSYDAFNASRYYHLTPGCASVSLAAAPGASAAAGTPIAITAAAAGCAHANPMYAFWILYPGSGSWQLAQAYTTSATFNWTTAGKPVGAYRFSVWVHDAGNSGFYGNSLGRYDAFNAGLFFKLVAPCTAVSVSASPTSPATAGTQITISGQAAACSNPQYEFWILAPGSSTWQLARGYSTSPSFVWTTTGKATGTYRFSVWVRDASGPGVYTNSLGSYDAFNAGQYFALR